MSAVREETITLVLTPECADLYICALADVLCWHSGFRAAKGDEYEGPPEILALRSLNIFLKEALNRADREGRA